MKFYNLSQKTPPLNEYLLVLYNNHLSFSQWIGTHFDIQPNSRMKWFTKDSIKYENIQPTHWTYLPEIFYD